MPRFASLPFLVVAACANAQPPVVHAPTALAGGALVARLACATCHDPGDGSLSGQTVAVPGTQSYGTNLTPDPDTGLGDWSDDDVVRALREGVDDDAQPLCPPMPRYPWLVDEDARSIALYLRSLPPVRRDDVPASTCPPLKGDAPDDEDAGVPLDLAAPATDLATAASDLGSSASDAGGACALVLNEVQTDGNAGSDDEFVELYATCDVAVDGWRLLYRSSSGSKDVDLLDLDGTIAAGRHFVVGGQGYTGAVDARARGPLASDGGGLALVDASGAVRDSLGWGDATNAYVEGHAAPAPPTARSIARHPDGARTGDDATDFTVGTPTPGAANGGG